MTNPKKITFLIITTVFFMLVGCSNKTYLKKQEFLMGTMIEITCPDQQAIEAGFKEIERIDKLLSKFNPESEISRLNKIGKLKVSPELLYVLKKAQDFYIKTNGSFDVTVAPLVEVWKKAIRLNKVPTKAEIKKAKELVGFSNVYIDEDKSVVSFLKEGVKIDLGAIAKGYAVDRAIRKIRELRVKSCLIDAGGDIYCLGNKEGDLWQVGIRHPRKKNEIMDIIKLESKAVATSGDYEQMFILNDKRYSHIIDPKTGYPADKGIISVTVIAPYCLTADALATSIFVLGKNKGMDLVNYYGNSEALIYNEEDIDAYDIF